MITKEEAIQQLDDMAMEAMHYAKLHELNFISVFDIRPDASEVKKVFYSDVWTQISAILEIFKQLPPTAQNSALDKIADILPEPPGGSIPMFQPPQQRSDVHVHVHLHGATSASAPGSAPHGGPAGVGGIAPAA